MKVAQYDGGHGGPPRVRFGPSGVPPVVKFLLIANIAIFVLQVIFGRFWNLAQTFGVSHFGLVQKLYLWQPFTYMFLHSTSDLWHIVFNMLALWWFGSPVENRLGSRAYLKFYLTAGIIAGLVYATFAVFDRAFAVPAIGASGAVLGTIVYLALVDPERPIYFFFVFRMPLKYVAALLVGVDLLYFVGIQGGGGSVAHSAHLGGAAYGYLHYRFSGSFKRFFERVERQSEVDRAKKDFEMREEVDRLLAKISEQGINSLSAREKKFLNRASKRGR